MAGCLFQQQITEKGNRIWVILPAAFGTGVLMLTWAVYVVSWMFSVCAGAEHGKGYLFNVTMPGYNTDNTSQNISEKEQKKCFRYRRR